MRTSECQDDPCSVGVVRTADPTLGGTKARRHEGEERDEVTKGRKDEGMEGRGESSIVNRQSSIV
ncbi:MAG: hypothetical protein V3W34_00455 [Phycisphaerae bacterium]